MSDFAIIDLPNGKYGIARRDGKRVGNSSFHRRQQAMDWIKLQMQKQEESYQNRKGYLFQYGSAPDVYGENLLNVPS